MVEAALYLDRPLGYGAVAAGMLPEMIGGVWASFTLGGGVYQASIKCCKKYSQKLRLGSGRNGKARATIAYQLQRQVSEGVDLLPFLALLTDAAPSLPAAAQSGRPGDSGGVTLARGACRALPGACDMVVSTAAHIRGRERLKTCPLVRPFPR